MPSSLVLLNTHVQQPNQVVSTKTDNHNNNNDNSTHDVAATDEKDDPSCLNDNSADIQRELQDRLQVIVTLRNTVVQQRERVALLKQTNRSQKRQMNILRSALNNNTAASASTAASSSSSPSSSTTPYMHMRWEELSLCELLEQDALQQERPRVVTFGPTFSKTDCIVLSNLPRGTVGMDHDEESKTDDAIPMTNNDCFANPSFRQTHTSLEQHAQKTETVLALAQLETAQQTIHSLRKELQQSETEREQLQQDLQQSQEDTATAKLQAELARTDAQQWQYDNTVLREERDRAITEQRATQERLHRLFVFVGQQHQMMGTANTTTTTSTSTTAGPHKPNPATVQASNDNEEKQQDCIDKIVADDSHESGPSQPRRLWSGQEETSDDNGHERHDKNNKDKAVNINTTGSLPKQSVGVNTTNSTNAVTETSRIDTETNTHKLKAAVVVDTATTTAAVTTTTTITKNTKQRNPSSVQTTAVARKRFAKPTSASLSLSANTTVRATRSKATDKEKRRSVSVRKERSSSTTRTAKQQSQQPNRKGGFLARLSSPFGLADSHNQHKSSSKVGKRGTSIASMSLSKNSTMTTTPRKQVQGDSTLKQQHTPSTVASESSSCDLSNHDGNDNNNDDQYFEDEYGMPLQGVQV